MAKSVMVIGLGRFGSSLAYNLFQQGLEIREVRGSEHFIFFNRITFGLMSILMKLESNIETKGALGIIMNRESQD